MSIRSVIRNQRALTLRLLEFLPVHNNPLEWQDLPILLPTPFIGIPRVLLDDDNMIAEMVVRLNYQMLRDAFCVAFGVTFGPDSVFFGPLTPFLASGHMNHSLTVQLQIAPWES